MHLDESSSESILLEIINHFSHNRSFETTFFKTFKKNFSCNGTLIKDEERGEIVQLSGDQVILFCFIKLKLNIEF